MNFFKNNRIFEIIFKEKKNVVAKVRKKFKKNLPNKFMKRCKLRRNLSLKRCIREKNKPKGINKIKKHYCIKRMNLYNLKSISL